jgi:cell division inhibitor SepF
MSMWRRTMLYLGLAPDEEYDDAAAAVPAPSRPAAGVTVEPVGPAVESREQMGEEGVRPISPQAAASSGVGVAVRPVSASPEEPPAVRPSPFSGGSTSSVRTIPARGKPNIVSPRSFNDAQHIADRFRADQIVIVNLQGAERDLARRLIDFCSGLCYGLAGQMEKVAHQVYLLTPRDAQLSEEERRRLQEQGLHR